MDISETLAPKSDQLDADRTREISFANHIIGEWNDAMDAFFRDVHRKAQARDLTDEQVATALDLGYGDNVAEQWREWADI